MFRFVGPSSSPVEATHTPGWLFEIFLVSVGLAVESPPCVLAGYKTVRCTVLSHFYVVFSVTGDLTRAFYPNLLSVVGWAGATLHVSRCCFVSILSLGMPDRLYPYCMPCLRMC